MSQSIFMAEWFVDDCPIIVVVPVYRIAIYDILLVLVFCPLILLPFFMLFCED